MTLVFLQNAFGRQFVRIPAAVFRFGGLRGDDDDDDDGSDGDDDDPREWTPPCSGAETLCVMYNVNLGVPSTL